MGTCLPIIMIRFGFQRAENTFYFYLDGVWDDGWDDVQVDDDDDEGFRGFQSFLSAAASMVAEIDILCWDS